LKEKQKKGGLSLLRTGRHPGPHNKNLANSIKK